MRVFEAPLVALVILSPVSAMGQELIAQKTSTDLSKPAPTASYWNSVTAQTLPLLGQPMAVPFAQGTNTESLTVQALHDGKWISFRLRWKDSEVNQDGKLSDFSDAVAVQLPVKKADEPPPIIMGFKDNPVLILHWRASYQSDNEAGKPEMKKLYPNMVSDMYHLDYAHSEKTFTEAEKSLYNPAKSLGNPQSFQKNSVDEIIAEGYGTSAVRENKGTKAQGKWQNGEWTVVITRPLALAGADALVPGQKSFASFAVWQGSKDEIGARKSLTMSWTPLALQK